VHEERKDVGMAEKLPLIRHLFTLEVGPTPARSISVAHSNQSPGAQLMFQYVSGLAY